MPTFEFLTVNHDNKIAEIALNRPSKANAMNEKLWFEIGAAMEWADQCADVRCVILRGEGPNFCAGIDLEFMGGLSGRIHGLSEGRKQEAMRAFILKLQASFTAIEVCRKPVIAAVQGVCYGGAIDLISACDIRCASADASFSIKEIDLAIVADIGTLQRLPHIIGAGRTRELALTGRVFKAQEALHIGLVTQLADDAKNLLLEAREQAARIAEKSPLAVRGTKHILNHSRDHSVAEGLDYVATWNAGMLLSADLRLAVEAFLAKRKAEFLD